MRILLLVCMPVLLVVRAQDSFPFLEDYGPDYHLGKRERTDIHFITLLRSLFHCLFLFALYFCLGIVETDPPPGTYQQQTEPTEPGPLDCREEQYACTRLYSVHKPCKQCLNSLCFYSLRRVYVINKEVCVRTVCAHEELLRADLCRDQFSRCGVAAVSGQCGSLGSSCGQSCGSC
ncbi:unnamed protein product [Merluccius merluccius]